MKQLTQQQKKKVNQLSNMIVRLTEGLSTEGKQQEQKIKENGRVRNPVLDFPLKSVKWGSTKRCLAETTRCDGLGHLQEFCSVGRNTRMFLLSALTYELLLPLLVSHDLSANQRYMSTGSI